MTSCLISLSHGVFTSITGLWTVGRNFPVPALCSFDSKGCHPWVSCHTFPAGSLGAQCFRVQCLLPIQSLPVCLSCLVKAHTRSPCRGLLKSDHHPPCSRDPPAPLWQKVDLEGSQVVMAKGKAPFGISAREGSLPMPTEVLLGARMSLIQIGSSLQKMGSLPAR